MVIRQPPPPPQLIHSQSYMEATEGHWGDAGQTRLKGMVVEEAGSVQIAQEGEMSGRDQRLIKSWSLTNMEEGDDKVDKVG